MRSIHRREAIPQLPKRKRVAAYARVSCDKETMLRSLSAQVSYFNNLIQRNAEWDFSGIYADEALTGTKAERPEFQRLMRDCRAGLVDMVVTKSISRFARNTVTTLEAVRELKTLGVEVWFERENIYSLSGDGELMLTILSSFAQEESRSASENQLWRIQKCFQKGETVGFNGMYGYDYRDGKIVVNEEQAAVLRQIFDWYIGGLGLTAISKRLNENGVPAYLGGRWSPTRIGKLISNEKLTGNALLQKRYTVDHICKTQKTNHGEKDQYFAEGTHPAIIDIITFEAAERIRRKRAVHYDAKDTSHLTYPFSGKVLCEQCGKYYRRKKAVDKFNWYCSTGNREGKTACSAKQIPEATLLAVSAEVLGLAEFDETVFKARINEMRVPGDNRLVFVLSNGEIVHREWRHRSRSESWTDDMKQRASEHAQRGHKGGSSK